VSLINNKAKQQQHDLKLKQLVKDAAKRGITVSIIKLEGKPNASAKT